MNSTTSKAQIPSCSSISLAISKKDIDNDKHLTLNVIQNTTGNVIVQPDNTTTKVDPFTKIPIGAPQVVSSHTTNMPYGKILASGC